MNNLLFPMARRLGKSLSSVAPPLPNISFDKDSLERCEKRLRHGSPVSAQGEDPKSLIPKVEDHRNKAFDSRQARRDAFKDLCDEFSEKPLEVPQILLSGYQRRCGVIDKLYGEAHPLASKESVTEFCKDMARVDRLIGSSIVTSCVHKEVLRRVRTNRR